MHNNLDAKVQICSSHYPPDANIYLVSSIIYGSNPNCHLFYADVGRNMHAESVHLKKEQERKKEMRKYKVGLSLGKSMRY